MVKYIKKPEISKNKFKTKTCYIHETRKPEKII